MSIMLSDPTLVEDGPVTDATPQPTPAPPAPVTAGDDLPVLDFVGPMAGFGEHRSYGLVELDGSGLLFSLRSLDDPGLRFLVVPPSAFFPDYAPEIDDDWVERLELRSAEEARVLLVVTPAERAQDATVNLLAPVVINARTRRAAQVVLSADLPVRAPLARS